MTTPALAALMKAFGKKLPNRLSALESALQRFSQGEVAALDDARRIAHKLHGTAGSFGYNHVSAIAGRIESMLDAGVPDRGALDSHMRELTIEVRRASEAD